MIVELNYIYGMRHIIFFYRLDTLTVVYGTGFRLYQDFHLFQLLFEFYS